ncbi:hypothetical protein A7P54_16180 [Acinetobacter sp. Ac_3412]|uniref:hypothetical protein n=1 Tax=Acinetobacter sp. Ac_3412 TaxID=1848935 RepID=UPI00148FB02F|nr:hypothetical protein [Acinetobacter sp. Ac_3412]NNP77937.1 hypothetical protein [Acinetobacter sp. Ac_3412]
MKYSFLWALYRQDKGKAIRKGCWFLLPSFANFLCFLNFHYQLIEWQVSPQSSIGRLISGPHFWWVILFDCIPFLLLATVRQRYLLILLKIWLLIAVSFFLINAWFCASYPYSTILLFALSFASLKQEQNQLMNTYIRPHS